MAILLTFVGLQLCDAATTLVFLAHGVGEGNPLVRALLHTASPAVGLVLAKTAACVLAMIAWRLQRVALLRRANVFFALCVLWNVAAAYCG
jgi:hypothetical protein